MAYAELAPNAVTAGGSGHWPAAPSGTRLDAIDEGFPSNDGTDYIFESSEDEWTDVAFEAAPADLDWASDVDVKIRCQLAAGQSPAEIWLQLYIDTGSGLESQGIYSIYLDVPGLWITETAPWGGNATWDIAAINSIKVRFWTNQRSKYAEELRISAVMLLVTYQTMPGDLFIEQLRPRIVTPPSVIPAPKTFGIGHPTLYAELPYAVPGAGLGTRFQRGAHVKPTPRTQRIGHPFVFSEPSTWPPAEIPGYMLATRTVLACHRVPTPHTEQVGFGVWLLRPMSPEVAGVMLASRFVPGVRVRHVPHTRHVRAHIIEFMQRYAIGWRGLYRIFNDAEYRFYRGTTTPPTERDVPFATNATLPHEPAETFADGTWYLSVSYFNGVIDSGFLPIGPNGETYIRMDVSGGAQTNAPPQAATDQRLEVRAGGVIRVLAFYHEGGSLRADEWAIAYTTDGSTPPTDTPDVTQAMTTGGLQVLEYDLPAQTDGTTVKVRVQTRREDAAWVYSENSIVLTAMADAVGPSAAEAIERWTGIIWEET